MAIFYIKRGDTSPALQLQLDPVVDLTGATVVFNLSTLGGTAVIDRGAASAGDDPTTGIVSYEWQAGDTDTPGRFAAEFEVTYGDGSVETFPNADFLQVAITKDLG